MTALLPVLAAADSGHAATIQATNVTTVLGPTFFIDDAANGGTDTDINQPGTAVLERSFTGLLARNQGPTRVTLTGFGFATHTSATANDATSVSVAFTYLGADEALGGGDDVVIGNTTGSFTFVDPLVNTNAEYALAFDTPLSSDLAITGTRFRIVVTPSNPTTNGSLKLKAVAPAYSPATGPKVSVAGVVAPVINPNRVNLAKYQTLTASSVNGNRLASYATDGDAGNDSQWQSQNWAFNNGRIDFPFPVEVGSAQVFMGVNDTLPLAKFGIQYLNGTNWTTIGGADVAGNTNVERNLVFTSPVTATSFRIMVTDPTIRLREFALYPPNGTNGYPLGTDIKLNLALQRPAVASSHAAGQFPINAVDGRTHAGSSWQTTAAGVNTLDIEMVSNTKIGSVHLYSGSTTSAPLADFKLRYWNGTAWLDIPGGVVSGNTTADRIVSFTPVTTTRVRLEFTRSGATPSVIRELQIFPANTGNVGYPLGTDVNPSGKYADYEQFNDAFYQITSVAANRDIAVATGGQPALEPAGITTAQAQYQVLLNLADGTYRLRNRDTGECLSGAQLSKTAGAALTDAPYVALPHQDWILEPLGGGRYRIVNAWSGLAIDTQGGGTAQGTGLVQNTLSSATSQQWRFNYDRWAPKKGLGHGELASALNADWVYRWGPNLPSGLRPHTVFHPMQWGNFNWTYNTGSGPIWQRTSEWRKRGDGMLMMGFNEPDRFDQSGRGLDPNNPQTIEEFSSSRAVTNAVNLWPQLMALNQPLVGPSPADDGTWLTAFTTDAKNRGFRWEYTAIHDYPGPNGGSSDGLIGKIQNYFNDYDLPVWLTEFSFVDWGKNQSWSEEDCYQALAEFLWRAENFAPLRKYALFVFTADDEYPQPANPWQAFSPAPRSNSYDQAGNLTAFGRLYAAWDSDTTVQPDKPYMIHHRGMRKRMANAATGNANPGGRTIRTDGPIVNWTLVSTGAANRYYVVSSIDGRRLSHTGTLAAPGTGASPTLAAAGTTGVNVEWSLTPTASQPEKGWYHLVHPASNTRLKLASFNTGNNVASYQMVAASTTDNSVQWRLIVPLTANSAPAFDPIPAQGVNEGTLLTFAANAADTSLPGGPLTYRIVSPNPPWGASINSATGEFRWTPTETQGDGSTYEMTIRASDGQLSTDQTVNITVNEVNVAPVLAAIPSRNVDEGTPLTFTATATDADLPANILTYSLVAAPPGATIDSGTGVFNWAPSEAEGPGAFNFTVRVSDGAASHDRTVSVTVNEVNAAPALATIPPQTADEGTQLAFAATATDVDLPENTLTYSLVGAPAGAAINPATGAFVWTPSEAQGPGTFDFTVRVNDGIANADRPVSVAVNEVNAPPVLAAIAPQTVDEGAQLAFAAAATDADLPANTLTYSLIGAPAGAAINPVSGVLTWTPTEAQGPGAFNFTIRVGDGTDIHERPASVTVNEVNAAPALAAIAAQTVDEEGPLTFAASATDGDVPANTLTYSLIGAPEGAAIDPATGVFNWTPTEAQGPGSFEFSVRVSDGVAANDRAATVTVNELNTAPVLAAIPSQSADEGTLLTFTATATDADLPANTLSYSLVDAPEGAAIDAATGVFTWTPTEAQAPASFTLTIRASDGDLTDDELVSVAVGDAPPAADADTDGDGLSDLMEHAFGTDPGTSNGSPFRALSRNADGTTTLGFPWNWQATGISWQIRHGCDLADIAAWPVVPPGPITTTRDGAVDHVTATPATIYPDCGYYILDVIAD